MYCEKSTHRIDERIHEVQTSHFISTNTVRYCNSLSVIVAISFKT